MCIYGVCMAMSVAGGVINFVCLFRLIRKGIFMFTFSIIIFLLKCILHLSSRRCRFYEIIRLNTIMVPLVDAVVGVITWILYTWCLDGWHVYILWYYRCDGFID